MKLKRVLVMMLVVETLMAMLLPTALAATCPSCGRSTYYLSSTSPGPNGTWTEFYKKHGDHNDVRYVSEMIEYWKCTTCSYNKNVSVKKYGSIFCDIG